MKKRVCGLTVLLLALLLTACGGKASPETTAATEPSFADGMEFAPPETLGVAVETPEITLYYPEEWRGIVTVEKTEEEEGCQLIFRTPVGDEEAELFRLIFSKSEHAEAFYLGKLKLGLGKAQRVYALMNETLPEHWSEEAADDFMTMQERINDLLVQLHEDPRFVPGK